MNDGTQGRDAGQSSEEAALSARLAHLDKRLSEIRNGRDGGDGQAEPDRQAQASAMARGFRLSAELVAGVLVGAGLGWLTDRLLGSSPWGMIVLLLLGFAAGVLNVMRTAGVASGGFPDSTDKR